MIKIESKNGEIDAYGSPPSDMLGCKETEAVWLSANVMVFSNNDIQINEDIAAALDLIPELVRRSKIDQLVDECSAWIKKRHTDFKEGDCIYDKRRMD